jgi:hypothetical protein
MVGEASMSREERIGESWNQERREAKREIQNTKITLTRGEWGIEEIEMECPHCFWSVKSTTPAVYDRQMFHCPNCTTASFIRLPKSSR